MNRTRERTQASQALDADMLLRATCRSLQRAQNRTEVRVEELADAQKRTETRVEELADAQKHTEKSLTNLARQVGGLSESFGGSLEDFALDIVPEILENHWKMKVDSADREEIQVNDKIVEFDLVIRGSIARKPVLVLGEVKSNLTKKEALSFLQLVSQVRSKAEIRPLFFGYRAQRDARDLIKKKGASMLFTHGKFLP